MTLLIKNRIKAIYRNQGITLVEVLVVLVLLAVVLAPTVNALSTADRIWSHNKAINPCIAQANTSMTRISREIRGAVQPSGTVDSVWAEDDGQRLIIYGYNETDSKWEKIIYQVRANKLNRIVISDTDPSAVISAAIPAESNTGWTTLLEGITSNPVFNRPVNSRTVEVNLQVSDSGQVNPRFPPFDLASAYMIRSREVGAITGAPVPDATEPPVVPAHKIIISPESTKMIISETNTHEQQVYITEIWPANATDKSITWTSSKSEWVAVDYDPNDSLHATMKLMKKQSDWSYWDFLNLWPPDVTITATANTGGTSATCKININKWL